MARKVDSLMDGWVDKIPKERELKGVRNFIL
jgi:hypothetical protein